MTEKQCGTHQQQVATLHLKNKFSLQLFQVGGQKSETKFDGEAVCHRHFHGQWHHSCPFVQCKLCSDLSCLEIGSYLFRL
jgi:hypothetical protein